MFNGLLFIFLLSQPVFSAEYFAKWKAPRTFREIIKDLAGLERLNTRSRTAIEVGPAEEPICSNCRYLDAGLYLEKPEQREKLILADARQMPLKEKSVDVFIFKNFPWLLPANVKTNGYQKMFGRMQVSYAKYGVRAFCWSRSA